MNEATLMATRYRDVIDPESSEPYQYEDDYDNPVISSTLRKERSSNVRVPQNFISNGDPGGYVPRSTSRPGGSRPSSRSSFDPPSFSEEELHVTSARPFDMADDGFVERIDSTLKSTHPTVESIAERMQPIITIPQPAGHEYSIKGPRYSDPSTFTGSRGRGFEDPSLEHDSFEGSGGGQIEFSRSLERQRRSAHYTQRGYNQWERVDNDDQRASESVSNEDGGLLDDQDPFDGLDAENYGQEESQWLVKGSRKIRPPRVHLPIEDETSTEADMRSKRRSPTNLQERSQQAWKSRQKKNSFQKKIVDTRAEEIESVRERSTQKVSFGGEDGVQYYEPPISEVTDHSCEDEKSLNSEYTKTLESEVEDMIKDVLFIGNGNTSRPGRRKYKYKHEVKKRLLEKDEMGMTSSPEQLKTLDEVDEDLPDESMITGPTASTPQTSHSSESSSRKADVTKPRRKAERPRKSTKSAQHKSNKLNDLSDAEATLWNFVEGGMTAVSTALGLLPPMDVDTPSRRETETQVADNFCAEPILPFPNCSGGRTPTADESSKKVYMSEVFEYAQRRVHTQMAEPQSTRSMSQDSSDDFNVSVKQNSSRESSRGSQRAVVDRLSPYLKDEMATARRIPFSLEGLGEDPRFKKLCLQAARSIHQTQGVEFDENYEISMDNDIQVSVVELKLPLGLIFLENTVGCFVTKVDHNGSAARSGGVEVGDQLAAINGISCFRMKVEDICDLVSKAPNPRCVELMFIRYIGPIMRTTKPRRKVAYDIDMTSGDAIELKQREAPPKEGSRLRGFRLFGRRKKKA